MTDPPEISELAAFIRTVDLGSLSAAARDLRQPRVTVARRIDRLEARLGARLLHRSTRRIRLTEAGEAAYAHARAAVEAAENAARAAQRADGVVRGMLRVAIPPGPGMEAMFAEFLAKYPEVHIEVHASSDAIDLADRRYDVAIRASSQFGPGLVARTLARVNVVACASPALLARHPVSRPEDLADTPCLCPLDGDRGRIDWPLTDGGTVRVRPLLASNNLELLRTLAVGHAGVALLPDMVTRADVSEGRLVHVLPDHIRLPSRLAVVYPERQLQPPVVRAFIEHAVATVPRLLPA